jgi:hypothetical protein
MLLWRVSSRCKPAAAGLVVQLQRARVTIAVPAKHDAGPRAGWCTPAWRVVAWDQHAARGQTDATRGIEHDDLRSIAARLRGVERVAFIDATKLTASR